MAKIKQKLKNFFRFSTRVHDPDWQLLIIAGLIIVFGLVMLTSASGGYAYYRYNDGYYFLKHQFLAILIGCALFWFFYKLDYHQLRRISFHMLVFSILLLILVFVPGFASTANFKARSWINIFGFSLQPSELVKLTFLIYLAGWLESRKQKQLEDFSQGIMPFLIVFGVIALLMLLQPDFGTLVIIGTVSLIAYYVGGGKITHVLGLVIVGFFFLLVAVKAKPYQLDRFRCYIDPTYSSNAACYQINQSLIAIGSGGFWGRGFAASKQKLLYLPEVSGDSIFAVIGEELGFLFCAALVLSFVWLFFRGAKISARAPDNFGKVLAIGITSWLTLQAMINIGGMTNLMPMTGVPLPFISFGGSAVMAGMAAVGVLANISQQTKS